MQLYIGKHVFYYIVGNWAFLNCLGLRSLIFFILFEHFIIYKNTTYSLKKIHPFYQNALLDFS